VILLRLLSPKAAGSHIDLARERLLQSRSNFALSKAWRKFEGRGGIQGELANLKGDNRKDDEDDNDDGNPIFHEFEEQFVSFDVFRKIRINLRVRRNRVLLRHRASHLGSGLLPGQHSKRSRAGVKRVRALS
jgi:hypothetical protein